MSREIWYRLVDNRGHPYNDTADDSITADPDSRLVKIRNEIYERN